MNKCFFYCYGGSNDRGEVLEINDKVSLSFPVEQEAGYGFCIRGKVDADFTNIKKICFKLHSTCQANAVVEYKTIFSGGTPEKSIKVKIKEGNTSITAEVGELMSELREICLFVPFDTNKELITDITFLGCNID